MTIDQAVKRLLAEAQRHRDEGRWLVGHEWQCRADEMERLAHVAASLPRPPKIRTKP